MMKDEKMTEEMAAELKKAGIEKDQIDDYMVWGVYKLMLGVMKVKWSLDKSGIKGEEASEKLDKIIDLIKSKPADEVHEMLHKSGDKDWK